jgi:homoserine kinase type II
MAVYTTVSSEDAAAVIGASVTAVAALPGGIENSNFRVSTDDSDLVLTVIERQDPARLHAPLGWMHQLHESGLPVPRLIAADGTLHGKPVVLSSWCAGEHVLAVNQAQAGAVGALLAEMHQRPPAVPLPPDDYYAASLAQFIAGAREHAGDDDIALLGQGESVTEAIAAMDLPQTAIHGDVFLDNLLFDGDTVSGLVDFPEACTGPHLLDLAIAANDLCSHDDGSLDPEREAALLWGYKGVRRLSSGEERAWRRMLALAAFRFWISRLWDREHPRSGPMPLIKDPHEFRRRFRARCEQLKDG